MRDDGGEALALRLGHLQAESLFAFGPPPWFLESGNAEVPEGDVMLANPLTAVDNRPGHEFEGNIVRIKRCEGSHPREHGQVGVGRHHHGGLDV